MPTLAAVLIVKNEEDNMAACLKTLQFVEEIVILDSGSTDNTLDIARHYTDKVFINTDWQGYGRHRQIAQSYASSDWILMIDADERVTDGLANEIRQAVNKNDTSKVYALPRLSYCFGSYIRHSGWYPDYVTRLYPAGRAQYSSSYVHEKLEHKDMPVVQLRADLLHYTYKNLHHYLVKSAWYADLWSKQKLEQGKSSDLFKAMLHGIACFIRMYIIRAGFLDGRSGLLLALLSAHSTFAKHADLWLKQNQKYIPQ